MEILRYVKKEQVIKDVIDALIKRFNANEAYFLEFKGKEYKCLYHYGWEGNCNLRHKLFSEGVEYWCIVENAPLVTPDILKDIRLMKSIIGFPGLDKFVSSKSLACVPVKGRYINGTITLIRESNFSNEEIYALVEAARDLSRTLDTFIRMRYTLMSSAFHDITERLLGYEVKSSPEEWAKQLEDAIKNTLMELGYPKEVVQALTISLAMFSPSGELRGELPCSLTDLNLLKRRCFALLRRDIVSSQESCRLSRQERFACIPLIYKDSILGIISLYLKGNFSNTSLAQEFMGDKEILKDLSAFLRYYISTELVPAYNLMLKVDDFLIGLEEKTSSKGRFDIDDILREASEFIYENIPNAEVLQAFKFLKGKEYLIYKRNPFRIRDYSLAGDIPQRELMKLKGNLDIPIKDDKGELKALIRLSSFSAPMRVGYHETLFLRRLVKGLRTLILKTLKYRQLEEENFSLKRKERAELQNLRKELKLYKQRYVELTETITKLEGLLRKSEFLSSTFSKLLETVPSQYSELTELFEKVVNELPELLTFQTKAIVALIWLPLSSTIDVAAYRGLSVSSVKKLKEQLKSLIDADSLKLVIDFDEPSLLPKDSQLMNIFPELRRYRTVIMIPLISNRFLTATKGKLQGAFVLTSSYRLSKDDIKEDLEYLKELGSIFGSLLEIYKLVRYSHRLDTGFNLVTDYLRKFYEGYVLEHDQSLHGYLSSMLDIVQNVLQPNLVFYAEYKEESEFVIRMIRGAMELEDKLQTSISFKRKFRLAKGEVEALLNPLRRGFIPNVDPLLFIDTPTDYEVVASLKNNIMIPMVTSRGLKGILFVAFMNGGISDLDFKMIGFLHQALNLLLENFYLYQEISSYKNLLEATFRSISDGLLVLDLQRRVLLLNPNAQRILGLDENVIGKDILDVLSPGYSRLFKDLDDTSPLLNMYIEGKGETLPFKEDKVVDRNGNDLYIRYTLSLIKDKDGYPKGYMLIVKDVTKEKEMEQERSDMIALLSHDIRNPLTAVKSYMSVLIKRSDKLSEEDKDRFLRIAKNELDRMARMLNNLIELVRLQSSEGLKVKLSEVNLTEMLKFYKESYDLLSLEHTFKLIMPEEEVHVIADREFLQHILDNLISNAVKYSPNGGTITIGVIMPKDRTSFLDVLPPDIELPDDQVIVFVRDQGIGIPESEQQNLFQRYYRVRDKKTMRIRGTGLGLYITRRLVEAQGGRIWVRSQEGKGSTFAFSLNLAKTLESEEKGEDTELKAVK